MAFHIIGDQDTVLGYRFAGVTGSVVETEVEAREALRNALQSDRHRILLLTEKVEGMLSKEVTEHRLAATPPYVVVIEDICGPHGERKLLQDLIYEAVGIRIVKEEPGNAGR